MKRLTFLEFLIFRLGGVSGCTRRLVFQKKGLFTANEIRAELALKYPRLVPAENQFESTIEQMVARGQIECAFSDSNCITYRVCPRRRRFQFRRARQQQLKFDFFNAVKA